MSKRQVEQAFMNDSCDYTSDSSDDVGGQLNDPMHYNLWMDEHFDKLMELYTMFRQHGDKVFGACFFQLGTHEDFIAFVHKHSVQL